MRLAWPDNDPLTANEHISIGPIEPQLWRSQFASPPRAAHRLFGYAAEEAVGRPVTILIPPDRHNEEPMILDRIRRGERIEHYETVRQRKDGSLVDISMTVSPIMDRNGNIVGASKIARDITESKRAQERQELLLREMNHRIRRFIENPRSSLTLRTNRIRLGM